LGFGFGVTRILPNVCRLSLNEKCCAFDVLTVMTLFSVDTRRHAQENLSADFKATLRGRYQPTDKDYD